MYPDVWAVTRHHLALGQRRQMLLDRIIEAQQRSFVQLHDRC
jgi:hypothetical protein